MYYDDDFYYEPSEFDQKVDEFKESLMKCVKEEFLQRMDALEKENESLRKFRDERNTIIRDYEARVMSAQVEAKRAEEKWKNARLHQLLGDFLTEGWGVGYTYEQGQKCDNCDEHRYIHFKSPQGRDLKEECDCAKRATVYHPKKVVLAKLYVQKKSWPFNDKTDWYGRYYRVEEKDDYDVYEMQSEVCKPGFECEKVQNKYWAVFLTEEDCQRYCNWLNEKESQNRAKEDK